MSRRPPANDDTEQGFLERWSRRKRGSGDPGDEEDAASQGLDESGTGNSRAEARVPEEEESVKTDEDMPELDSINDATDMSDFFSPGVSENLRNQALRRLFRTSKFNVVDPLDDYNENFRSFALLGDLVTSEMRHRLETKEQRRREAGQAADSAPDGEPTAEEPVEDIDRQDPEPGGTAAEAGHDDGAPGRDPDETDNDGDAPPRTRT